MAQTSDDLLKTFVYKCIPGYLMGSSAMALLAVGVFTGILTSSSVLKAETLSEALISTYYNNPTLLASRASLRGVDEGVPQALSNWRPEVTLSSSVGVRAVKNTLLTGSSRNSTRKPVSVDLSVTQYLYRGGRTEAQINVAEKEVLAERSRLISTEQTIFLQAITAFVNTHRDEAVLELNQNNEQVLARQLEATRDRFDVGEITRTDVYQAEARLAEANADTVQALGNLEGSRATYESVIGVYPKGSLKAPLNNTIGVTEKNQVIDRASKANPDVISAEFSYASAQNYVEQVRGELRPTVSASAGVSRDYQSSSDSGRIDALEVGINLSVPLYQQGEVFSRLREAKQAVAESARNIDIVRRTSIEQASRSWEKVMTSKARVSALNTAIEANLVALDGVEREAAVGSRTVLDVLDAEQALLDSRVTLVRAERDEVIASYELLASIGELTAKNLNLDVKLYDPAAYYREVRDVWIGARANGGEQ